MKKKSLILIPLVLLISSCGGTNNLENNNNPGDNNKPGDINPGNNNNSQNITYNPLNTFETDEEYIDLTVNSTGTDEEGILVKNNANVKFNNLSLSRINSSSTGGDNSSFYGVGSAFLTTSGNSYIKNSSIYTDAKGAAGVFSYSEGTSYIFNSTITTKEDTSGGIHAAGNGTLYAFNNTVSTYGESSAAIRSDRGGGLIYAESGSYSSHGIGSPAIYSTADISVNDLTLNAYGSEAICIEGLNSIKMFNSSLNGNMSDMEGNDLTWNIIIYQSMSGDSEVGKGAFYSKDSSITANNGGMFYCTNTESDILLDNTTIDIKDNSFLLQVTGNTNSRGWGTQNSNGGDCNFTLRNENISGDIIFDSISSLDLYLIDSKLETSFVLDESYITTTGNKTHNVYIDKNSTLTLTKSSTISSLYLEGNIIDSNNKIVKIYDSNNNLLNNGTSDISLIVEDSYSMSCDTLGAIDEINLDEVKVNKPDYFLS